MFQAEATTNEEFTFCVKELQKEREQFELVLCLSTMSLCEEKCWKSTLKHKHQSGLVFHIVNLQFVTSVDAQVS